MVNNELSWSKYATKYDMLLEYNPFYQALHKEVLSKTENWQINEGDIIVDFGAGTGNYSCSLAEKFPQAKVIHIDNDRGMNAVTQSKKEKRQLNNLEIRTINIDEINFEANSLKAITSIHALYTFPQPKTILKNMYQWLKPNGYGILVDPGRKVNVLDWQIAIGYQMIKKHGLRKTLNVLQEGKEVSKQNREISKLQEKGIYWKHSHEEFCEAITTASFNILEAGLTFRKISDIVVVTK